MNKGIKRLQDISGIIGIIFTAASLIFAVNFFYLSKEINPKISKQAEDVKSINLRQDEFELQLNLVSDLIEKVTGLESKIQTEGKEYAGLKAEEIELKYRIGQMEKRWLAIEHLSNNISVYLAPVALVSVSGVSNSGEVLIGSGVGVLVSDEYFLTAGHVTSPPQIVSSKDITVFFPLLNTSLSLKDPVYSEDNLLALFRIDQEDAEKIKKFELFYFNIADVNTVENSPIVFRLSPTMDRMSMSVVSYGHIVNQKDAFLVTCCDDAYMGDSGSPLLVYNPINNQLELAGITESIFMGLNESYQALHARSTSSEQIAKFLEKNGVK